LFNKKGGSNLKNKKTVTEKQIEANRRNSKRSTGARTERGQRHAKFNAVKAGLFAESVVVSVVDGPGSDVEFERLVADLREQFQAKSRMEEFWVSQLADSIWTFRRAAIAKKGSIDTAVFESNSHTVNSTFYTLEDLVLASALDELEKTGTIRPKIYDAVCPILKSSGLETAPDKIAASLATYCAKRDEVDARLCLKLNAELHRASNDSHALPPEVDIKKILRCEAAARRKHDWALQNLVKLGRGRQAI
jgi:hypothetical protein